MLTVTDDGLGAPDQVLQIMYVPPPVVVRDVEIIIMMSIESLLMMNLAFNSIPYHYMR